MKNTTNKFVRAICGMVVMLAILASITSISVLGASNGIYIATATPHYKHPTTGVIEDSGGSNSSVLGQSMTESATYKKALVEVDPAGNTYVTVRLQLMDNIQNPQFQVDGSPVSAYLMQEDFTNNTADYRMQVNSENSIIRCNMYVTAMGRDVIFYITVSNLTSGSEDFITSVTVETPQQNNTQQNNTQQNNSYQSNQQQSDSQYNSTQQDNSYQNNSQQSYNDTQNANQQVDNNSSAQTSVTATEAETEPVTENKTEKTTEEATEKSTEEETEETTESTEIVGIQEFEVAEESTDKATEADSNSTENNNSGSGWIIAVVIVVAVVGIGAVCFLLYKKKIRS